MNIHPEVKIRRDAKVTLYSFNDYFEGFEHVEAVQRILGDKTVEVLKNLKVEFIGVTWAYMGVSDLDGHLVVGAPYLQNGEYNSIYLDVIHELTHVQQFIEGKALFDGNFEYVDRPTELEAYRNAVTEARNLGLNDEQILAYLKTEWMSDEDHHKLAQALHIPVKKKQKTPDNAKE